MQYTDTHQSYEASDTKQRWPRQAGRYSIYLLCPGGMEDWVGL